MSKLNAKALFENVVQHDPDDGECFYFEMSEETFDEFHKDSPSWFYHRGTTVTYEVFLNPPLCQNIIFQQFDGKKKFLGRLWFSREPDGSFRPQDNDGTNAFLIFADPLITKYKAVLKTF